MTEHKAEKSNLFKQVNKIIKRFFFFSVKISLICVLINLFFNHNILFIKKLFFISTLPLFCLLLIFFIPLICSIYWIDSYKSAPSFKFFFNDDTMNEIVLFLKLLTFLMFMNLITLQNVVELLYELKLIKFSFFKTYSELFRFFSDMQSSSLWVLIFFLFPIVFYKIYSLINRK